MGYLQLPQSEKRSTYGLALLNEPFVLIANRGGPNLENQHIGKGSSRECVITFCIMTLHRTPWLKRSVSSIREYCPVEYLTKILSQGKPDQELTHYLEELGDERIQLIISPVNLGYGGGRKLLSELVSTQFVMMMDDDVYLTEGAIESALRVFQTNPEVGALTMPLYDLQGRMMALGGRNMIIKNGVIHWQIPKLSLEACWTEANDLSGGAILYRIELGDSFSWDPRAADFEDYDKSLQIIRKGKWKQAIVPSGRLVHDRSWLGHVEEYDKIRLDGMSWRRSYRYIRAKWGLRFDMRSHVLYELVYPALALTRCGWLVSAFNKFVQTRATRGKRPFMREPGQTGRLVHQGS